MRFNQNLYLNEIIISIIILITNSVHNTNSVINVSQIAPLVSVGQHNHITASDRPQHYYNYNLTATELRRSKRSHSHQRYIEVMVAADAKMAEYHGDSLRLYVLTLMATVELIYRDASIGNAIKIALVKLAVMDEEESKDLIYASASKTLRNFCRWQHMHNEANDSHPSHYDTAILLTREDLCRMPNICDTLGLAQSGQICDVSSSCAVIEDNGLSAAFTIAHELGHILSIPHDDDDKCIRFREEGQRHHIMARMLDYTSHPWTWSACSRHYITEFLDEGNGDCLLDKPSEDLLSDVWPSVTGHSSIQQLRQPGELFDMDLQCQLVFGPSSKICPFMPVCKRLWCTINTDGGGCRTQHMPWADGTPCAQNKWCQQGECVSIQRLEAHPIDGHWGQWDDYNDCSRSCGGGVQRSIRHCNHPKPQFGGKYCTGHRIRYRSCSTHECPAAIGDFREEQCKAFNGQTFNINGLTASVKWTTHYTGINADLCKLYCNVVGTGAYYLLKQKVIDGTPCAPDSYDVCVSGKCMSAGCDHILGSDVKTDSCGVCAGDNSTCKLISGHLHRVRYGYNLVGVVPVGATNLDVRQYGSSATDDNYLALRDQDSSYLINGDFVVSMFRKRIQFGGTTIEYSGSNEAVERINTSKPLTRELYIEVLSVGNLSSPEVNYHYAISLERDKYEWRMNDKWSECNRVCNGEQMLTALCFAANTSKAVDEAYCSNETKPTPKAQVCNMHCQLVWKIVKQWPCSVSCGVGTKKRHIRCTQELYNGDNHELHDFYCQHIGAKPEEYMPCNGSCNGLNWLYSEWSDCSTSCGQGVQVRNAVCVDKEGTQRKSEECETVTPKLIKQSCQVDHCPLWQTEPWSDCSEVCGTGEKHRTVRCKHSEKVIDDSYCDSELKPKSVESCQNKACGGQWYFGEWSPCENCVIMSERVVRCRSSTGDLLGSTECNLKEKPIESRECRYLNDNCNNNTVDALQSISAQPRGQWRTGMWSQCSSSCGFGFKKRYVACLYDNMVLDERQCDLDSKPDAQQKCEIICNDLESDELYNWRVGLWGECHTMCDEGVQRRLVLCYHQSGRVVDETLCDSIKRPNDTTVCFLAKCEGNWRTSDWTQCSKSCGSDGLQSRSVECVDFNANIISDDLCYKPSKPTPERSCNQIECSKSDTYEWRLGQWEECKSTDCETNGTQQRKVFCVNRNDESIALHFCGTSIPITLRSCAPKAKCTPNPNLINIMTSFQTSTQSSSISRPITQSTTPAITSLTDPSVTPMTTLSEISSIIPSLITSSDTSPDSLSNLSTDPRSVSQSTDSEQTKWMSSEWSQCSESCGNGTQTRTTFCTTDCSPNDKPVIEVRHCFRLCSLFQWKAFQWSKCSASCGKGYKSRAIKCLDWTNSVVPNQFCDPSSKPKSIGRCKRDGCRFVWRSSHWSQCTKTCGQGVQVRRLTCHRANREGWVDPSPTKKRKTTKQMLFGWCNETVKPITKRVCNYGDCSRGAIWKPGTWQPCSTSCGSGKQLRKVFCFSINGKKVPKSYCELKLRPQKRRKCNVRPCLPTI